MRRDLKLEILPQPTLTTCGPTSLHAVYRYYGLDLALDRLIDEVRALEAGGTLAVYLGCDALERGFEATIYTYNMQVFDPTWFVPGVDLADRLRAQAEIKNDRPQLRIATAAYLRFLELGGRLEFVELNSLLLLRHLREGRPILTGLSATYLYGCAREREDDVEDDLRGDPVGHFVVLVGYDASKRHVLVADPLHDNPRFGSPYYAVRVQRLLGAILLGIVTYDANLLVLESREESSSHRT
jgi:hypothetical protein